LKHLTLSAGPMRGVLAGTSVKGPESQEGVCESLMGPIFLAVHVLFRFFHFCRGYFQLFLV
jgi:hypothetical protein